MEQDIPRIDANDLIERYEVLLLDAYGVLVDSSGARLGARHLIDHLNNTGKAYYIVTNDSSRLPTTASERYRSFGLCIDAERIVVSGSLLGNHFLDNSLNGANCVVLGTAPNTSSMQAVESSHWLTPSTSWPSERFRTTFPSAQLNRL